MNKLKTTDLYILGAGGHAKVVVASFQKNHAYKNFIFIDQARSERNEKVLSQFTIIKKEPNFEKGDKAHIAIGCNHTRKKIAQDTLNVEWPPIIHPSAIIHESVQIGAGTFIGPGVIINPDVGIGKHCIINTGAIIEHDCVIKNYAHIAPGSTLCGNVEVDDLTLLGAGTTVLPGIKIGHESVIGAGSVVISDVPNHKKVAGNPCKNI